MIPLRSDMSIPVERFDPYHKWLGIPVKDQPPNHYRLLAIETFENDPDVIDNAADQRTAYVRSFSTTKYARFAHRLLNEISAARLCLLDRHRKAAYDDSLREKLARLARKEAESQPKKTPSAQKPLAALAEAGRPADPPPDAVEYADALPAEAAVGVQELKLLDSPIRRRWK